MKRFMCVLFALLLTFGMFGCGKKDDRIRDLDAVQESGVLKVGVMDCAPFAYNEQGNWTGFDAALAEEVGRKLNVTIRFIELDWEQRWEALEKGLVDCVWCGVSATDQLAARVDLSQSYLASRPVLVVSPEYQETKQFTGAKIAAEKDSACALAAEACLGSVTLMQVSSQKTAIEAVISGEAAGAVVDLAFAGAQNREDLVVRTDLEMGTEELKVALRKNSDLTEAVNEALTEIQTEGTLDALAEKYQLKQWLVVG